MQLNFMKAYRKQARARLKRKKSKTRPTELEKYIATKSDAQLMAMLRRGMPEKYGDFASHHFDPAEVFRSLVVRRILVLGFIIGHKIPLPDNGGNVR